MPYRTSDVQALPNRHFRQSWSSSPQICEEAVQKQIGLISRPYLRTSLVGPAYSQANLDANLVLINRPLRQPGTILSETTMYPHHRGHSLLLLKLNLDFLKAASSRHQVLSTHCHLYRPPIPKGNRHVIHLRDVPRRFNIQQRVLLPPHAQHGVGVICPG